MEGSPAEHPRARRAVGAVVTIVVALAGGIALLLFFVARDDAPVNSGGEATEAAGPGQVFPDQGARHLSPGQKPDVQYNSDPPTSGPHAVEPITRDGARLSDDQILHALEQGNVVVLYGSRKPPAGLEEMAQDVSGGPFDPALVDAGQAVVLGRRRGTDGVVALAWRHRLRASSPSDPELQRFAELWLGRGQQG